MGAYVYRVTKETAIIDGQKANIAIFAYKPFYSVFDQDKNHKMAVQSGCLASIRMAKSGKNMTDKIVIGRKDDTGKIVVYTDSKVYYNSLMSGTFVDDELGNKYFPVINTK